jgi:hypothetical protein
MILAILKDAPISAHNKKMIKILLPTMADKDVDELYTTLKSGRDKMLQLDQKEQRIILKYQMIGEKMRDAK